MKRKEQEAVWKEELLKEKHWMELHYAIRDIQNVVLNVFGKDAHWARKVVKENE